MEKLLLSDVRKPLKIKIQEGINLEGLCRLRERITFDFDVFLPSINMNLQRDFVWSIFQKQQLILSVLKDITLPPISVVIYEDEERNKTYQVIDGKQRLNALFDFLDNKFPIIWKGYTFLFEDLDKYAQQEISYLSLRSDRIYEYWDEPVSDEIKLQWFEKINFLGTPQDEKHLEKLKAKSYDSKST